MDVYNCPPNSESLPTDCLNQLERNNQHLVTNTTHFEMIHHVTTSASPSVNVSNNTTTANVSAAPKRQNSPKQSQQNKQFKFAPQQSNFKNKKNSSSIPSFVIHNTAYLKDPHNVSQLAHIELLNHGDGTNGDNAPDDYEQETTTEYPYKLYITGYAPYVRANDLIRACARFGPVRCERRTPRASVVAFAHAEHAEAATRTAARKMVFVYGSPLKIHPYVPDRDPIAMPKQNKEKERSLAVPPEELDLDGEFAEQAEALLARVRLTREHVERLVELYADVERALAPLWPRCRAVPFGSITTGLGTKASDADCFVELPPDARAHAVIRARRALQQHPQLFDDVIGIPRASTPIVKLLHVPTATKCDLSFKSPLGTLNSRLLAHLLHRAPVYARLAVLLKYWASVHTLSGTGRLSNYALVLLLIHYLQRREPPLLPPVAALQRDLASTCYVDNWNAGFDERAAPDFPRPRDAELPDLLGDFFRYYAEFEFERHVVSPYAGGPLPRDAFRRPEALPDEYALYRRNVLEQLEPPLRVETPWCVQDPFVHSHNVASGVNAGFAADLVAHVRFAAAAYAEERAAGHRRLLRRLLLERPQLAKRATIAIYNIHLKQRTLVAAGPDWKGRLRRATRDIFERIFGVTLVERRQADDEQRLDRDEYEGRMERHLWKQRKQRRPRGAADMPFLERELATTAALAATAPLQPLIGLRLRLKMAKHNASLSVRLVEGDVVSFRDFGNYLMSVGQSWYQKLLEGEPPQCKKDAAQPSAGVRESPSADAPAPSDRLPRAPPEPAVVAPPLVSPPTPPPLPPAADPDRLTAPEDSLTSPPLKLFDNDSTRVDDSVSLVL